MRVPFTALFTLLFFAGIAQSAKGYYVTLKNDTVTTRFSLKKDLLGNRASLYEEVSIIEPNNETVRLNPTRIKGYYIEINGMASSFVSMQTPTWDSWYFLRLHKQSPIFDVYEYTLEYDIRGRTFTNYLLVKPGGSQLFLTADLGNIKAKKSLRTFCAGDERLLKAMKGLYDYPGYTERDTKIFLQRVFKAQ